MSTPLPPATAETVDRKTTASDENGKTPQASFDNILVEVIGTILLIARDTIEHESHATIGIGPRPKFPDSFTRVCKQWNHIIDETAQFWTDIHVTRTTISETVQRHFEKSDDRPLDLWIEPEGLQNRACRDVLLTRPERWRRFVVICSTGRGQANLGQDLVLWGGTGDIVDWIPEDVEFGGLKELHVEGLQLLSANLATVNFSLPQLEDVSFSDTIRRWYLPQSRGIRNLSFQGCYMPLRNLVRYICEGNQAFIKLEFRNGTLTSSADAMALWTAPVDLPRLQELIFIFDFDGYDNLLHDLLMYVHCPNLERMRYRCRGDLNPHWTPIRHLDLGNLKSLNFKDHTLPMGAFNDILRATRTLVELKMPKLPTLEAVGQAKTILIESCPKTLESLTVTSVSMAWLREVVGEFPSLDYLDLKGDGGESGRLARMQQEGASAEREHLMWLQERVRGLV